MKQSLEMAQEFLYALDPTTDVFTFQTFDDGRGNKSLARIRHGTLKDCFSWLAGLNNQGAGIFVMAQKGDGSGRNNKAVTGIRCVFNECDHGWAAKSPLTPQLVVSTSPGRTQEYFLCEGLSLDEFGPIQARLIADYGSDPNAADLARVLRVPGFLHNKNPDTPHLVNINSHVNLPRYSRAQIITAFPPYCKIKNNKEATPVVITKEILGDVQSALTALSPDTGYKDWSDVGIALKSLGDAGYTLWVGWSMPSKWFDLNEINDKWPGFHPDNTGYASIIKKAQKTGWVNPATLRAQAKQIDTTAIDWEHADVSVPVRANDEHGVVLPSLGDVIVWPHMNDKGRGLNTIENLRYMLSKYGIKCYYDEILRTQHISFPWDSHEVHDLSDVCAIQKIRSIAASNRIDQSIVEHLPAIFEDNIVNPIKNWITGKPWDGVSRLADLFNTVKTDDETYKNAVMRRWLIQCIAAMDGCKTTKNPDARAKYELVLVLQGAQGTKKTSWFRQLVPKEFDDYVLDGVHLDIADKDSIKKAISGWLSELGELDGTLRKSDIGKLKGFLSNRCDNMRLPYDRVASRLQRRTSFCASVNDSKFFNDDTGNRRFAALSVYAINAEHNIDMQQVWAEVWQLYSAGEQWWLTDAEAELRDENNKNYEPIDPVEDAIATVFDLTKKNSGARFTITQIAEQCGIQLNKSNINKIAKVLRGYGFERKASMGSRFFILTTNIVSQFDS